LDDAAQATRIERSFLDALERDAPLEEFPEPMYARAFLREYARFLGLRDRRLMEDYEAAHPMKKQPPIGIPPVRLRPGRPPWGKRILVAGSIGALAALAIFSARATRGPEAEAPESPAVPSAASPSAPEPRSTPKEEPEPALQGVTLDLRVVGEACWIRVTKADQVLFEGTREGGFHDVFHAKDELLLRLGNAAAVRLQANGERVQLPQGTTVFEASFVAQGGGHVKVVPAA
jgi:cytoskeletal protein RodZ